MKEKIKVNKIGINKMTKWILLLGIALAIFSISAFADRTCDGTCWEKGAEGCRCATSMGDGWEDTDKDCDWHCITYYDNQRCIGSQGYKDKHEPTSCRSQSETGFQGCDWTTTTVIDNTLSCCTRTDGGWSTTWSTCTSCSQHKSCNNPEPSCGGADCPGSTPTQSCGTVNCVWDNWGAWSNAAQSCGTRTRSKTTVEACGGTCSGSSTETLACGKSAVFISKINNTGGSANYGIATWTADTQAGTSIKVKIRTSNDPNMIGAQDWTTCDFVTNGQDISSNNCVHDGNKYIQYWLNLSTNDQAITPVFKDMTISYGICNEICSVRSGFSCPSGQIGILSLTDDDDAHATLYGSNTFGYSLCCENIAGTVTNSDGCGSNTYLVSLSSGSISEQHAGKSTYYANDICLSGTQFTGCYFADSGSYNYGCGTDTCFMSLSSQTDAHVGSCNSPFTKKVC